MKTLTTGMLEIGYIANEATDGPVALLLHGWPDDATTWNQIVPMLSGAGVRIVAPWLRGFGPTRFLSAKSIRDGRPEALAADAIALMDGLGINRFAVIGHDWGARTTYALAALIPERLTSIAALSLGYSPRGAFPVPAFKQSQAWWYQWFMSVDRGAEAVARDPKGFARLQWETWSPPGWFTDADFEEAARSFENADWLPITFNSYRNRWRDEERDPQYEPLRAKIASVEKLAVPTLMIHGAADGTILPETTEALDRHFTGPYRRHLIEGVGHFPMRESPCEVAKVLQEHLREFSGAT